MAVAPFFCLFTNSDDGEHAFTFAPVAPPGKEFPSAATRTGGIRVNLGGGDAGGCEDAEVGGAEVEPRAPAQIVPIRKDFPEQHTDLAPGFKAARADGRAESGAKPRGIGAEADAQSLDARGRHAGEGAAPTGMHGGDGAVLGVGDENGNTVGGFDGDALAGPAGDEAIGFEILRPFAGGGNAGGVDLAKHKKAVFGRSGGGAEGVIEPRLGREKRGVVESAGCAGEAHATGFCT